MSFTSLLSESVTIRRLGAGALDSKGNSTAVYADLATVAARVWAQDGLEDQAGRWVTIQSWRAVMPAGTDVTVKDRITWDGHTLEVESAVPVIGGTAEHHVAVQLREVH